MANGIFDLIQGQLSQGMVEQIANQLGGADKQQTQSAASSAINVLLGAIAKNASTPEGSSALANALEKDHDGSVLDNFMELATGAMQPSNSRALNGAGILKHVLGGKQNTAIDMISKMSGIGGDKAGSLLTMLAPMVMGALGKTKAQSGLDAGGLGSLLQNVVKQEAPQRKEMGLVEKLLDQDGDGSIMDDVAGLGMKVLGGLFKK